MVYIVLDKSTKTELVRKHIRHIHIRVPLGFAYYIQFALQNIVEARGLVDPHTWIQELPGGNKTWRMQELVFTNGEIRAEGPTAGVNFTFKVNQPMAGIRPLKATDSTHVVLSAGYVKYHDLQAIALPEHNCSGVIKISFKCILTEKQGKGQNVKYLEQQMLRPHPEVCEALITLGQVIFGGHQTDREEREALLQKVANPRQQLPNPITQDLGRIWAQAGGTVGTLDASWHAANRAAHRRAVNAPATTPKRKLEGDYRGWRTGGGSSSSSSTWRSNHAWSDAGTTSNEADSQASGSRWDWRDPAPSGQWVPKKAKDEQHQGPQ